MTTQKAAPGAAVAVANGPEDEPLDWHAIDWRAVEDDVRRLRQRIFTASQVGDLKRVRSLQKLMLRSRANTLLSVRRVTEVNAGRKTAGIDGMVVLLAPGKAELASWVQHRSEPWRARPVKRVYIPKAKGKQRPLGIPVLVDRVLQARVVNALEPEWEARFEPRSYGFRPGRGCHDAIGAIFHVARGANPGRRWALDADLAAAFDRIDHDYLLRQLGTFPARGLIAGWLKAGVVEKGRVAPTEQGTPQGGVISPLLLNVALHGMEQAAGVRYHTASVDGVVTESGSPVLIRYADDLVALCHTRDEAEQVKARLAGWLAPRGLTFNEDKTRIVTLDDGFDFLGFTVRRQSGKLLIKPSNAALRRIRERLRTEMRALRGANAAMVLVRLNPIIRGWTAYYRTVVSSAAFAALDSYLWRLTYKWAKHGHANKPRHWIINQYFGSFNRSRRDRWVFGNRDSGAYLVRFAWTSIVRHRMVRGSSSPDDPALAHYWADRRRRGAPPPMDHLSLRLLKTQNGCCPCCGDLLLYADHPPQTPAEWEQWARVTSKALRKQSLTHWKRDGSGEISSLRLIQRASPVLRGAGRSNAPGLPGEGRALRTETTINDSHDFSIGKRLCNLPELAQVGFSANRRLLDVERLTSDPTIGQDAFRAVADPIVVNNQRASALPFDSARTQALLSALVVFRLLPHGFRNTDLRAHLAPLLGLDPSLMTQGRMSYDLRRLRLHGLIERLPGTHRYTVTDHGFHLAVFLTRVHNRLLRPGLSEALAQHSPDTPLRHELQRLDNLIEQLTNKHKLTA